MVVAPDQGRALSVTVTRDDIANLLVAGSLPALVRLLLRDLKRYRRWLGIVIAIDLVSIRDSTRFMIRLLSDLRIDIFGATSFTRLWPTRLAEDRQSDRTG